eukprot:TRINITY_DN9152_c0_g1_i1.p1 TRINITY_DN9152_c0_g1~~TRINITY_DN9152_c0_g1_i1.p1  ORF type:complete len:105 (+),score=8.92 TRINITY_DN9152_c0_g1_i1:304-618(+)
MKRVNVVDMDKVILNLNEYHILTNDLLKLKEIRDMVLKGLSLEKHCYIYVFLQREGFRELQHEIKLFSTSISKLDDYLTAKIDVVENTRKGIKAATKTTTNPSY